jgi:hypothetical protein
MGAGTKGTEDKWLRYDVKAGRQGVAISGLERHK